MVTIADVSREAAVSTATVSRVVNHPERVDAGTRAHVLAVIAALGYRPNELARGLASRASRTVGIVINLFGSSYYGRMLDGAVHALDELGFHAIVQASGESAEGEERAWDSLKGRRCEALIVHSDRLSDARLATLMDEHPTAVLLNRRLAGFERRCVHLDNRHGGALAAEHLIGRGHGRLATITGPRDYFETNDRAAGFRDVLERHRLTMPRALEIEGDFTEEGGLAGTATLLDSGEAFTGLFCQNDEMAAGALECCRRRGVRVPEALSVIGFDDLSVARYLTPKLTTVRQPLVELGSASARLAHALATGRPSHERDLPRVFEPRTIERASTAAPPGPVDGTAPPFPR